MVAVISGIRDAWQDCAQNAMLGMLDAMERFDPFFGVAFSTFARPRVRGTVFDGLRALGGTVVSAQTGILPAERTASVLDVDFSEDGGENLEVFVAITAELGIGFLLDTQSVLISDCATSNVYAEIERDNLVDAIIRKMELLQERERIILALHYFHGLPFAEIAIRLQLTRGRVSQLHKRALNELRNLLEVFEPAHC